MKEVTLADVLAELKELRRELHAAGSALLSIDEAALFLGLSPRTIRNCLGPRAQKPFPIRAVKHGGKVLFRRVDLQSYVDSLGELC